MYHKNYMKPLAQKESRSGFTIVELIIVIIVIAILATIAIVSYGSVRRDSIKSSYDATAQQVKLKLGEYYTDNNHYPLQKTDVSAYLTAINAGSTLIAEFAKAEYDYDAYTDSTGTTVCAAAAACQHYTITIAKSNWEGDSTDSNIVVMP